MDHKNCFQISMSLLILTFEESVRFETMSKQHLFLPILIYFSCNVVTSSIVNVPILGAIRGKAIKTVGNLNYDQKTYYTFRNIPYAESVSGSKRFSVINLIH